MRAGDTNKQSCAFFPITNSFSLFARAFSPVPNAHHEKKAYGQSQNPQKFFNA
jgi:hypothetical protein